MILLFVMFFLIGLATLFFTSKLGVGFRIGIALAVFIIPSLISYIWLDNIGDKPLPGSIIVTPDKKPKDR